MVYNNFVRIKDISASNYIWGGEEIIILATKFKVSGGNIISNVEKTFQDTTITTADSPDTTTDMKNNYNRRKSNVSYGGFSNQTIEVSLIFNNENIGNTALIAGVTKKIFTPSRLYELILNPRTVYIKDEILVELLQSSQDGAPIVYGTNGIPVLLQDWDITPSMQGKESVINLTFKEDKGSVA